MRPQEAIQVAVVIERIANPNAWEAWSFRLLEVLPDQGAFGTAPRCLHDDGKTSRWLFPAWRVELFPDECKGYFLNLTSGRPVWFVFWVPHETDVSMVKLTGVSMSYIEADRRMTAEEVVENIALEPELCEWLRVFTNTHFRPDTGRKVRAMSFLTPEERERHHQQHAPVADKAPDRVLDRVLDTALDIAPPGADNSARNEALRHLFHTDPHFKQSDGLDVAIDEVVAESGSALARQRKIKQARAMGLLDDELQDQHSASGEPPPA
jgi:Protein of unknown function (DUF3305)